MNLREQAERGERAKRLLEDELLKEVISSYESEIYKQWSTAQDDERRKALWFEQYAAKMLLSRLITHVQNGLIAKQQIEAGNE